MRSEGCSAATLVILASLNLACSTIGLDSPSELYNFILFRKEAGSIETNKTLLANWIHVKEIFSAEYPINHVTDFPGSTYFPFRIRRD
jgi:hypothetical protein